jgi:hypothetical protein
VLRISEGGLASATTATRPLARLWNRIGTLLDGDISRLATDNLLVWMPAHQTTAAIGNRTLSTGKKLSVVDWRANRLVDALAKQAAMQRQAPFAVLRLLASARAAVRHAACLLGRVTHAANNCKLEVTLPDGSREHRTFRDAQQVTGQRKKARIPRVRQEPPTPSAALLPMDCLDSQPCKRSATQATLQASHRAKVARTEKARSAAAAEAHVQRVLEETRSRLTVPAGRLPASVRLQGVLDRVRARTARG